MKGNKRIFNQFRFQLFPIFSSRRKLDFWCDFVRENKIKAFVEHTTCPTLRLGAEQLLRLSGLGGMKANTLVLNIDHDIDQVNNIVKDALCLEKNVVLLRNIENLNRQILSVSTLHCRYTTVVRLSFSRQKVQ